MILRCAVLVSLAFVVTATLHEVSCCTGEKLLDCSKLTNEAACSHAAGGVGCIWSGVEQCGKCKVSDLSDSCVGVCHSERAPHACQPLARHDDGTISECGCTIKKVTKKKKKSGGK